MLTSFCRYSVAGARIQHAAGRRLDLLRRQDAQSGYCRSTTRTPNVERNRELFLKAVGAVNEDGSLWPLAQVRQIHSAIIHRIDAESGRMRLAGDGMITNTPGLLLAIKTADCVPVLVADVKRRVVGAFHAGWRGTAARVVEKGVGEMRRQFGSRPGDLRAAIGPCIRKCCYSVGDEVRAEFESQFTYADELFEEVFDSNAIHIRYPMLFLNQRAPGHGDMGPEIHLDLVAANQRQLEDAGVQRGAHLRRRRMHRVRHEALLLASRRVRQDRPDDGGDRNSAGVIRHPEQQNPAARAGFVSNSTRTKAGALAVWLFAAFGNRCCGRGGAT